MYKYEQDDVIILVGCYSYITNIVVVSHKIITAYKYMAIKVFIERL